MGLSNYTSFTADQLKTIRDNIDRLLKESSTITPPPPICIKVISNVVAANSLDKKGFIYNKNEDAFENGWDYQSIDEIVEQNSKSASRSVAFSFAQSIYHYYDDDKASLGLWGNHRTYNHHSLRPLFLFKE